jgi:hypothetical protein
MSYRAIADSEIAPFAPLTADLFTGLRDAIEALSTRAITPIAIVNSAVAIGSYVKAVEARIYIPDFVVGVSGTRISLSTSGTITSGATVGTNLTLMYYWELAGGASSPVVSIPVNAPSSTGGDTQNIALDCTPTPGFNTVTLWARVAAGGGNLSSASVQWNGLVNPSYLYSLPIR